MIVACDMFLSILRSLSHFLSPSLSLFNSQEDLLIHGDSVYDIIDKQDHATIQAELNRNVPPPPGGSNSSSNVGVGVGVADSTASNGNGGASSLEGEHRMFLCRMNVSRNARRQMRFGDQKVSICV